MSEASRFAESTETVPTRMDTTTTRRPAKAIRLMNQLLVLSETKTVTQWQDCCGKEASKKHFSNTKGKHPTWECLYVTENHNCSRPYMWTVSRWLEREKVGTNVEKFRETKSTWKVRPLCLLSSIPLAPREKQWLSTTLSKAKSDLFWRVTSTEVRDEKHSFFFSTNHRVE